jgi:hypothetical protein
VRSIKVTSLVVLATLFCLPLQHAFAVPLGETHSYWKNGPVQIFNVSTSLITTPALASGTYVVVAKAVIYNTSGSTFTISCTSSLNGAGDDAVVVVAPNSSQTAVMEYVATSTGSQATGISCSGGPGSAPFTIRAEAMKIVTQYVPTSSSNIAR